QVSILVAITNNMAIYMLTTQPLPHLNYTH
ncbi:MAG: hypothetical protein ACI8R8_001525, partial [Paraglaciecola sp.]